MVRGSSRRWRSIGSRAVLIRALFSLLFVALGCLQFHEVQATNWLTGWQNRRAITLTGQSGAGSNFQVKLAVGESAGSAGANFHLSGHSASFPSGKNDGGDLRFTDNDGSTLLSYWVESVSGTAPNRTATIWVKVADSLDSNADIYLYYNKAGATSTSSGVTTFLLFDDFSAANLDTSKWTSQAATNSTISLANSQITFTSGTQVSGKNYMWIHSNATYAYPVWMESKVDRFYSTGATFRMGASTSTNIRLTGLDNGNFYNEFSADAVSNTYRIVSDSSCFACGYQDAASASMSDTSGIWSFSWVSQASQVFKVNYVTKLTSTSNRFAISNPYMYVGNATANTGSTLVDWARIRKYLATEPSFSSAAVEESSVISTTTTVSSSLNPSTYGGSVTFRATVMSGAVVATGATGTIQFKDGGSDLGGAVTIGHGSGSLTLSSLSVGSHTITAVYGGDTNYATSTSSPLTQTVNQATTTTTVSSSLNPSTYGASVTFTATVTSGATGTVTVKDGSTTISTCTLSGNSCTVSTSSLSVGSHTITAVYGGDTNYATSTSSPLTQTVNQATTTTTVSSSLNPSTYGGSVTFRATVMSGAVVATGATGTIQFKDGGSDLGGAVTIGHGSGSLTLSSLSVGSHTITAVYGGDTNYATSTSSPLTQTVAESPASASSASSADTSPAAVKGGSHGGRYAESGEMHTRVTTAFRQILARFQAHVLSVTSNSSASSSSRPAVVREIPPQPTSPVTAFSSASSATSAAASSAPPPRPTPLVAMNRCLNTTGTRNRLTALVENQEVLFNDVVLDAWYAPYVCYTVEERIAQGYRDDAGKLTGVYGVENRVTYAEVLKMALEAAGADLKGAGTPRNPSAQNSWASAYVAKAEQLNLSVFKTTLSVNAPATRGAVVQTILETLGVTIGKTPAAYDDVPKTHPHSAAIAAATFFGLVTGDTGPDGTPLHRFRPDDPINRAEVAKIVALARELMGKNDASVR